ncbi:SIMPL domain-containing protein [Paenibacillus arenilitoris]|uniref:SIMPL domain-containing protein n=1 Tax=Paenibacillus arenilitoris TaxID=2772299 RepID=A0A927H661_9BACL|nr:SIMPL domain-containing protein [Paenibacillus arenilitoris]MBD2869253.1 SIMPL domain-containing protein [Paenibacillus arenilitoris]
MPNHSFHGAPAADRSKCAFSIEVVGDGTVDAAPDRAVVVLGAITEGTSLQEVQNENAEAVTAIIDALLALGIPRENIQTKDFRIETQYDYVDGRQVFRGYQVTHMLQVTIEDVDDTGRVIDTAVSSGANSVTSIQFTTAQPEAYVNQALSLAVRDAHQKALTIAGTLGVALAAVPSGVQQISRVQEPPVPFQSAMLMKSAATPIEPGQLTYRAAVRAWYMYG